MRDLDLLEAHAAFGWVQYVGHEHVESFSDGLKHDEIERNAGQRVRHAEHLAGVSLGRAVAVPFTKQQQQHTLLTASGRWRNSGYKCESYSQITWKFYLTYRQDEVDSYM